MKSFENLGLQEDLLKAIQLLNFETPTEIQEQTIPHILGEGKDLVALAQTGTGKTAAFGLPLLMKLSKEERAVQTLIVCPTRELCVQITRDMHAFAKFMPHVNILDVYGGSSIDRQITQLKKGAQIVVGTPGRLNDLINRKALKLQSIRYVVLDEADEMLSMGFKEDMTKILAETPDDRTTFLFSATMPADIVSISNRFMKDHVKITVGRKNQGTENVVHSYYVVHSKNRYSALKRIADLHPKVYGIVFCRTRVETKEVADKLIKDNYSADALHGDLSQAQRDQVMGRFRMKGIQLLVATDVAARGLDVNDLTHVINYNLPDDLESYIHRSGRTGRAGKKGQSVAIINTREVSKIKQIEKKIGRDIEYKMIPSGEEICNKQLFNLIDKIEKAEVNHERINPFMDEIFKKLSWLSKEELLKHIVSVEFNQILEYYKNTSDLNADLSKSRGGRTKSEGGRTRSESGRTRSEGGRTRSEGGRTRSEGGRTRSESRNAEGIDFTRFFLNVGSKDNLNPVKLMGIINDNVQKRGIEIGKIDIMKNFSFFEIDANFKGDLMNSLNNGVNFNGQTLNIEIAQAKDGSGGGSGVKRKAKRKRNNKENK